MNQSIAKKIMDEYPARLVRPRDGTARAWEVWVADFYLGMVLITNGRWRAVLYPLLREEDYDLYHTASSEQSHSVLRGIEARYNCHSPVVYPKREQAIAWLRSESKVRGLLNETWLATVSPLEALGEAAE